MFSDTLGIFSGDQPLHHICDHLNGFCGVCALSNEVDQLMFKIGQFLMPPSFC